MLALLALIPRPVLLAVAVLFAALAGAQSVRLHLAQHDAAGLRVALTDERLALAEAGRAAEAAARSEESRRTAAIDKVARDARSKTLAAAAAADDLRGELGRLRERAETLAATGGDHCGPNAAIGGPPADAPAAVLADMLGRVAGAAGELAAEADARGRAGNACQRAYSAVTGAE